MSNFFKFNELRDIGVLSIGNGFSYIAALVVIPIISYHFKPEDFAELGKILSFSLILSVILNLRIDLSIPNTESQSERNKRLEAGIKSSIFLSILIFSMLLMSLLILGSKNISMHYLAIPFIAFSISITNLLTFFNIAKKKFKLISISKVSQISSNSIAQLIFYFFKSNYLGLIFSAFLQYVVAIAILKPSIKFKLSFLEFYNKLIELKKYTVFTTAAAFFNMSGTHVPLLIIAFYEPVLAGKIFLANKFAQIPLNIFASSIGQTFASNVYKECENNSVKRYLLISHRNSLLIITIPSIIIIYLSQYLDLIMGEEWLGTANIIAALSIAYIFQGVSTSTASIFYALKKNEVLAFIDFIGSFIRIVSIIISIIYFPEHLLQTLIITIIISFIIYIPYQYLIAIKNDRKF